MELTKEEKAIKTIESFIKKQGYTYRPSSVIESYLKYWKKGYYVSYTMRDCIENLKSELEEIDSIPSLINIIEKQQKTIEGLTNEHFDTLVYLSTLNNAEEIHKAIKDIVQEG